MSKSAIKSWSIVATLAGGLGLAACAGTGAAYADGTVSAGVSYYGEPPLVEISPGVWVVEAYTDPVFYYDNSYWLYRNNLWYRSPYYNRGWVTVYDVPYRLRVIDRPYAYSRYYAPYGSRWRQGPRGRIIVRDYDEYRDRYYRGYYDRRYYDRRYYDRRYDQRYYDRRYDQRYRDGRYDYDRRRAYPR